MSTRFFPQFSRYYVKDTHLKSKSKRIMSPNKISCNERKRLQEYDYFLVLDFEATCEKNKKLNPQEIIEFPCLKVNGQTFEIEDRFHEYVQPVVHPHLSSFCTELTGIIQEMVDDCPTLETTLKMFHNWMEENDLLKDEVKSTFVTCGDWDLKVMLPSQCSYLNLDVPSYFKKWVNIKQSFCEHHGVWPKSLMVMLRTLSISHEGRLHSGIDDCKNIAKVLKHLGTSGYIF